MPPPGDDLPSRRDLARQEAGRLRYELARLRARRTVRLALLAGHRGSIRDMMATLRGERVPADLDVLPPTVVTHRPTYPHLRVAHTGERAPFGGVAPHALVATRDDLTGAEPDLLVVTGPGHEGLADHARTMHVPVVALDAGGTADLRVVTTADGLGGAGADLALAPWVDARVDNPVGWRLRSPLHVSPPPGRQRTAAVIAALATGQLVSAQHEGLPIDLLPFVEALPEDRDERERRAVAGWRHVLRTHEALARFEAVLEALDIPRRPPARVSVLLCTRRPGQLEHAIAQVDRQDHPDVEVVVVLHGEHPADAEERLARGRHPTVVRRVDGTWRFGDALNVGLDAATGDLVAKMDDDDHYGPRHLSDLELALRYSGADVVGRWANEVHLVGPDVTVVQDGDRQERWAHHLPGATILVHGDVLRSLRFRRVDRAIDTHLVRAIHAAGGAAYATHRFGFVRTRHGDEHTFRRRDASFGSTGQRTGLDTSILDV